VLVPLLTEPSEESVLVDVYTSDLSGLFIFILAIIGSPASGATGRSRARSSRRPTARAMPAWIGAAFTAGYAPLRARDVH
jgi:hypothetical protein